MSLSNKQQEEFNKCVNDDKYFFENYCQKAFKEPTPYSEEIFEEYKHRVKHLRGMYKKQMNNHKNTGMNYFSFVREHPLTPEEAFPLLNFIK